MDILKIINKVKRDYTMFDTPEARAKWLKQWQLAATINHLVAEANGNDDALEEIWKQYPKFRPHPVKEKKRPKHYTKKEKMIIRINSLINKCK